MNTRRISQLLDTAAEFTGRHIGPRPAELDAMAAVAGYPSAAALVAAAVPAGIALDEELELPLGLSERDVLRAIRDIAADNKVLRSYIGMGYSDCISPPILVRNILEDPGWYTQYTPYQAEISQGRLEALLIFQHLVSDLTGLDVANASLLDEATAAAEAMTMSRASVRKKGATKFVVSDACHPQTLAVVQTRAEPQGITVEVVEDVLAAIDDTTFGVLAQYPDTRGQITDLEPVCVRAHEVGALVTVATDLLALTLLRAPGEFGADIAVGSAQRFGVSMGFGGPHAAFFATRPKYQRRMPGRLVGVSVDADGNPALRLALQTREQHIRRERATSNICTSQVLLAIVAAFYAVYHGPEGLVAIAERVRLLTAVLADALEALGFDVLAGPRFDTLQVSMTREEASALAAAAVVEGMNFRHAGTAVGISLDETTELSDLADIIAVFAAGAEVPELEALVAKHEGDSLPAPFARESSFLEHEVFARYHSETEMLRFLHRLKAKDLSLTASMTPLGSCTMKLNGAAEMMPITWPEFGGLHPFVPADQARGYARLFEELGAMLMEITGFAGISFQPNAGSQGEYSGLLVIRKYHSARGQGHRNVCLIPSSAHGTNPASAVMAGLKVVVVRCDDAGNIDVADLEAKAAEHADNLAALMVTYPSTHGVFEESIQHLCEVVHGHGGQVYMDGANLNAQVGLCKPRHIGADVAHLNLHKTFAIPHGGGGPGVGPIVVASHLVEHLPTHPVVSTGGSNGIGAIAAAPWGSPSILPVSWAYIKLMGRRGLKAASEAAVVNANYIAARLDAHYPVLYRGEAGVVAHECILDLRGFKRSHLSVDDVAKRLMDYGFHAPTVSWPVAGTMMVEPTESESKAELDRFCDAMIAIRHEIERVESGELDPHDNPLTNAPHTAARLLDDPWDHPYTRAEAAYPAPSCRISKFWPPVSRIDNTAGDRTLVCALVPGDYD